MDFRRTRILFLKKLNKHRNGSLDYPVSASRQCARDSGSNLPGFIIQLFILCTLDYRAVKNKEYGVWSIEVESTEYRVHVHSTINRFLGNIPLSYSL